MAAFHKTAADYDGLLRESLTAFANADYHCYGNVEEEISVALKSPASNKVAMLRRLVPMLSTSNLPAGRSLAGRITARVIG